MKVRVLGCGAAGGVPSLSRGWGACDPGNPRNRRSRPSVLVTGDDGTRILVDTSPDLRDQLLDAGTNCVEAVLYTHEHADHMHGIDDLREINRVSRRNLPVYGQANVLDSVRTRFGYVVGAVAADESIYKPMLDLHPITLGEVFQVGGVGVLAFDQDHGFSRSTGFRFGPLAYSTDVVDMPEESFRALTGLDTWIVSCLSLDPHPTHAHLARVLDWVERLRPRRTILTHMTPSLDYDRLRAMLPPDIQPAYDGLEIEVGQEPGGAS